MSEDGLCDSNHELRCMSSRCCKKPLISFFDFSIRFLTP